jgi:hypothetical protein
VTEADIVPPSKDKDEPAEVAELPVYLFPAWAAYTMLEVDESGNAKIWSSGLACLDELGITARAERLRWIRLWHAANSARAEMAEIAREEAAANTNR